MVKSASTRLFSLRRTVVCCSKQATEMIWKWKRQDCSFSVSVESEELPVQDSA